MNRIFLSFLMSMFLFGCSSAQFTLLVEGGVNYGKADLKVEEDVENFYLEHENILGYYLSATPKFAVFNRVTALVEFQYSVEGADVNSNFVTGNTITRVHYIRFIPGVEVDVLGPLSVSTGVNVGYGAVQTLSDGNQTRTLDQDFRLYSRSDFGLLFGASLNFGGFNVSANYNLGLKDINDIRYVDIEGRIMSGISVKNRFLQVGIGYEFGL